jgi:hypothetical protein
MDTAIAYLSNAFVAGAIGLALGIVFGQKIKDYVMGVPTDVRSAADSLVTKVKADLASARLDVIAKFVPVAVKPPAAPPAPAAVQVAVPAAAPPAAPAA